MRLGDIARGFADIPSGVVAFLTLRDASFFATVCSEITENLKTVGRDGLYEFCSWEDPETVQNQSAWQTH